MFEFDESATFKTDWTHPAFTAHGFAVDSEDNIYLDFLGLDNANGTVVKYTSAGVEIGQITGRGIPAVALAVDAVTNDLYVGTGNEAAFSVLRYEPGCAIRPGGQGCVPVESFASQHLHYSHGLTLDGSGAADTLFAPERNFGEVAGFADVTVPDVHTVKASGFTSGSAVLNGVVNPSGLPVTECYFEWGETESYGQKAPCESPDAGELLGEEPRHANGEVPVHAEAKGLQQGHTYHFRLVAVNANDVLEPSVSTGTDLAFGPPLLDSQSVSAVTSTSATLEAQVNPDNVDTKVQVEYGPTEAYGSSTPLVDLGSGGVDVGVAPVVEGLAAGSEYHYRVRAESALAEGPQAAVGKDHTFTTQRAGLTGQSVLADGREWEQVTPPDKHGAGLIAHPQGGVFDGERLAIQAAASGGAFTFVATGPTESAPAGNVGLTQVFAARGPHGWESHDLSLPHDEAANGNGGQEYRVFSSDLSLGLVQPFDAFDPLLSPGEGSEQTPYLHQSWVASDPSVPCTVGCYRPLVTGANAGEGVQFGLSLSGKPCPPEILCGPQYEGGTPDMSHVVVYSATGVTEAKQTQLLEWSAGQLKLVNIGPGGGLLGEPTLGGETTDEGFSAYVTAEMPRHAVSTDGSRVVWTTGSPAEHLFLRDMVGEHTVQLDRAQGVPEPLGHFGARFQDASADDSRVFFTEESKLTPGAGATNGEPDLYECRIIDPEGEPTCALSDLTPETGGEPADVQAAGPGSSEGAVIGASEDGSSVYFVADGRLTGSTQNEHGEVAVAGQPNLYVSHEGVTSLIAVLEGQDNTDWAQQDPDDPLPELTARVSPDGRWLAFLSHRELTGYDNRDAKTGQPDDEVFLYHAPASEGEPGSLSCASCDPSKARPIGSSGVPGWTSPRYQSRYLSDGGRLFFNSSDALVPQDTNHAQDVYEYEPPNGEGAPAGDTCTPEASTYSPTSEGCVNLVSSGKSPLESSFLDATEDGSEVFFLTNAQLVPQDTDTSTDVYDAHICTTGSPSPPPPPPPITPCSGDACQPAGIAPEDPAQTLIAPAPPAPKAETPPKPKTAEQLRIEHLGKALKTCRRDKSKKKRATCERTARKKYAPPRKAKKSRKSSSAERAGRR
jgi:hypothetical protein